jgi:hypothetical protein
VTGKLGAKSIGFRSSNPPAIDKVFSKTPFLDALLTSCQSAADWGWFLNLLTSAFSRSEVTSPRLPDLVAAVVGRVVTSPYHSLSCLHCHANPTPIPTITTASEANSVPSEGTPAAKGQTAIMNAGNAIA